MDALATSINYPTKIHTDEMHFSLSFLITLTLPYAKVQTEIRIDKILALAYNTGLDFTTLHRSLMALWRYFPLEKLSAAKPAGGYFSPLEILSGDEVAS